MCFFFSLDKAFKIMCVTLAAVSILQKISTEAISQARQAVVNL